MGEAKANKKVQQEGPSSARIDIVGMTCASCTSGVERRVKELPGVSAVRVNLLTNSAVVEFDGSLIVAADVVNAIEDLGYDAKLVPTASGEFTVLQVDVTGMTCSSCVATIERAMKEHIGVRGISVNLVTGVAEVTYDPSVVGPRDIVQAIEDLGYDAKIKRSSGTSLADSHQAAQRAALIPMLLSFVFAVPSLLIAMVFPYIPALAAPFDREIIPGLTVGAVVLLCLATPVQLVLAKRFYVGAYRALRNRSANMDVLIVIGTVAAYVYSIASLFLNVAYAPCVSPLYNVNSNWPCVALPSTTRVRMM